MRALPTRPPLDAEAAAGDGTFMRWRATHARDRPAVSRDGANLAVDIDTLHERDADPAGWTRAVLRLA